MRSRVGPYVLALSDPAALTVFLLLAAAGHVVLWVAVVNRVHGLGIQRKIVDGVTFLSGVALVAVPAACLGFIWAAGDARAIWGPGGAALALRAYGGLAAVIAIASAVHRVWLAGRPERRGALRSVQRTEIDLRAEHGLELAAPRARRLCALPGNQALTLSVEEKTLAIPRLPAALEGLRIAHLADLHMSGRFTMAMYQEIVALANARSPDLVALTGDLVEHDRCLPWVEETLARLRAELGVFFIFGNHDKLCDTRRLREILTSAGATCLSGGHTRVERNGAAIELVGNEIPWFPPAGEFPTPAREADTLRVVLAHSPDQFFWAIERDADLVLAGHTHGGQIRFPPLGAVVAPSRHGTRYNSGVFQRGGTVMHVTRGTGSLAPLRYFCPPELALLTLKRADGEETGPRV